MKSGGKIEVEGLRELVMATDKHEISALSSPLPGISRNSQQHLGTVPKVENNFARTHRKNLEMDQRTILFQFPRMYFFSKYYCFLHSLCHCHCLPIGFTKCLSWSNSGCSIYFVIVRQLCPTVMHRLNHHLSHVSQFHLKLPSQTEFAFQCNM